MAGKTGEVNAGYSLTQSVLWNGNCIRGRPLCQQLFLLVVNGAGLMVGVQCNSGRSFSSNAMVSELLRSHLYHDSHARAWELVLVEVDHFA